MQYATGDMTARDTVRFLQASPEWGHPDTAMAKMHFSAKQILSILVKNKYEKTKKANKTQKKPDSMPSCYQ